MTKENKTLKNNYVRELKFAGTKSDCIFRLVYFLCY